MKKLFFVLVSVMLICVSSAEALQLPDKINDWILTSEFVTPLIPDANSEDLGRCIYKNYSRRKPIENLTVILAQGKGFGNLNVPSEIPEENSKTLMKSQTGYEILEVAGYKAIFEKHEILPDVLAISVGNFETLTLESNSLTQNELIKLAERLLKK